MSFKNLVWAGLFGIGPLVLFGDPVFLLVIVPVFMLKAYLSRYFKRWIGGYTGDCLGATQQVTEIIFYASLLVLWKFI